MPQICNSGSIYHFSSGWINWSLSQGTRPDLSSALLPIRPSSHTLSDPCRFHTTKRLLPLSPPHTTAISPSSQNFWTISLEEACPILWKKVSWPLFLLNGPDFPHRWIKIISSLDLCTGSLRQTSTISKQQQGSYKKKRPCGYHQNRCEARRTEGSQCWWPGTNRNNPWGTIPIVPAVDNRTPLFIALLL